MTHRSRGVATGSLAAWLLTLALLATPTGAQAVGGIAQSAADVVVASLTEALSEAACAGLSARHPVPRGTRGQAPASASAPATVPATTTIQEENPCTS